jgi:hypothetical protein
MADVPLKYALPIIAVALMPLGIAVYSLLSTNLTAAPTKTKSPYWGGSRKADACIFAKGEYFEALGKGRFKPHYDVEMGGILGANCTAVKFSGDHNEYASVDFNAEEGAERWRVEWELREKSPAHWENLGGRETDIRIATTR